MLPDALQLSTEERHAFKQVVSYKRRLPTAARPVARLPAEPTPFIGREREEGQALRLPRWGELPLLTLTGPDGVGKTRLAVRVAGRIAAEFADGAAFVSLIPADGAERVIALIASALEIPPRVSLGDVRFEAAWRHGGAMSMDEAIALALSVVP
jgi:hypothetical protein